MPARGREDTYPVTSKRFKDWLRCRYLALTMRASSSQALSDAISTLEAQARYEGEQRDVQVRLARVEDAIFLDLADEQGHTVMVDKTGWRVLGSSCVKFRRDTRMLPLPLPTQGGSLEALRPLLNVPDEMSWTLTKVWLMSALRGRSPYLAMIVQGEQGSAKSTFCRLLRDLIDPANGGLRAPPREERDFVIAGAHSLVLAYDNLSGLSASLADALCRVATGAGWATRALYTDDDEVVFDLARPVMMNGIDDLAGRPDLASRSVVLHLPTILDEDRRTEDELLAKFKAVRPQVLGALLDAVVEALRNEGAVRLERLPRMADAALWGTAAERALGVAPGGVMDALEANAAASVDQALDADSIAAILIEFAHTKAVVNGRWTGTATELLERLTGLGGHRASSDRNWPRTASHLTNRLRRLGPALKRVGVVIEAGRTKRRREVSIVVVEPSGVEDGDTKGEQEVFYFD